MKIDLDNYELFFIDYLDGTLPEGQIDAFLDFLEKNPHLKEELHGLSPIKLTPKTVIFAGKEKLGRSTEEIHPADELAIAFMEGDLPAQQREAFWASATENQIKASRLQQFEQTRLRPDLDIVFPNKKKLLRKKSVLLYWQIPASIAAVLLLALLIWPTRPELPQTGLAQNAADKIENNNLQPKPQNEIVSEELLLAEKIIFDKPQNQQPLPKLEKIKTIQEKELVENRAAERESAPPMVKPILAELTVPGNEPSGLLVSMKQNAPNSTSVKSETLDEFLVRKTIGDNQLPDLSVRSVANAGLRLVARASSERITYTAENGKVTALGLNTRLLAFSVPINNN